MYRKQMKFQKIICYLALAAGAIVFVYSLGLLTDLYDSLYQMMPDPSDASSDYVQGVRIYYEMQDFNRALTRAGVILILLAAFMMIMNTHIRRRYYIGNYIAIAVFSGVSIGYSIWGLARLSAYKEQFLTTIDFEQLAFWSELWKSTYSESTFWFDAGKVVFGLLLAVVVLLIINLIWKIRVTNEEKNLINQGKGAMING